MRRTTKFLPILAAGLVLGACGDDLGSGPDTGRLTIQLTDAPGDLASAWIKIDQFVLVGDEGNITIEPEEGDYIDLLTLAGGQVMEIVDNAAVDAGVYQELRLVLDEAYVELDDGRIFATAGADLPAGVEADGVLKCPSCSQSGYKVKFADGGFEIDENSVVLIDFDVAQSFGHEAGQSGMWIMHPVLRATAETVQLGLIKGNVTLATGLVLPATCGTVAGSLAQFKPFAVLNNDTITGTVDAAGAMRITGLMPGTYTVGAYPDITFTNGDSLTFAFTPSAATAVVAAGDSATINYQLTTATCH